MPDRESVSRYEQLGHVKNEAPVPKPVVLPKLFGAAEWLMTLVFVVELLLLPFTDPSLSFLGAVFIGSCLSLPSMLAGWSSVRSGVWRYVLTVLLALLNGFILTWTVGSEFDLLLVLLPLASAMPTLITLWLIKRVFGRFAPLDSEAEHFLEGLRFNLSHLFIVTTLLAVLLAIGKALWPFLEFTAPPGAMVALGSLVVLFSFNTLMFVWALMGQRVVLRTCIAIPVGIVTLMTCAWVCDPNGGSSDDFTWYTLTGLPLISSFGLMAVLRCSGWRFWKAVR